MGSISNKTLYIDYLAPFGHVSLNNCLLEAETDINKRHLISKSSYLSKIDSGCKKIAFFQLPLKSKIIDHFNSILALFQILFLQLKYDKLIFLSFENRIFPIFSYFFLKKTFVFVHNNLDNNVFSYLNLFSIINKKVTFIAFEKFISEFIQSKYGFENHRIIDHPILTDFSSQSLQKMDIVFAPGISNRYDEISETKIVEFLKQNNLELITKVPFSRQSSKKIISRKHFSDINKFFYSSKWVLINCNYQYRVSGIFYEAIGAECKILYCDKSLFLKKMKTKYPTIIYHIDELINESDNYS